MGFQNPSGHRCPFDVANEKGSGMLELKDSSVVVHLPTGRAVKMMESSAVLKRGVGYEMSRLGHYLTQVLLPHPRTGRSYSVGRFSGEGASGNCLWWGRGLEHSGCPLDRSMVCTG